MSGQPDDVTPSPPASQDGERGRTVTRPDVEVYQYEIYAGHRSVGELSPDVLQAASVSSSQS